MLSTYPELLQSYATIQFEQRQRQRQRQAAMLSLPACSPFRLPPTRCGARRKSAAAATITMRDRSKNRKPTQRGRYLSTEAIQAVQSLKRAVLRGAPAASAAAVVEPKLRRLLKADMVAVFRELAAQGEALLALQVRAAICVVLAASPAARMKLLGMALVAILSVARQILRHILLINCL
jgi:hypothetical protein